MSGKVGRPPEDRIARRCEIWAAVSPLVAERGARSLTMRQAAAAAHLSLGGLYHYFPTKRSLLLFGTDQVALERICHDFHARYDALRHRDPEAHLVAFLRFFASKLGFVRPAVQAAPELGAPDFRERLAANLTLGLDGFVETLRRVRPDSSDDELRAVARSIRRLFFAGLVDPTVSPQEFEQELRLLVAGTAAVARSKPVLAATPA